MTVSLLDLGAQHASLRDELDGAISRVVAHGQFVDGPEIAEFENAFADFCDTRCCIGTSS